MKITCMTIGLLAAAIFLLMSQPALCQQSTDPYAMFFDKEVIKCEQKLMFMTSKSAHLRDDAKRASFKLAYLRDYRDELIADMKKEQIETKDYLISHYLTERFLEVYSPYVASGQKQAPLQ